MTSIKPLTPEEEKTINICMSQIKRIYGKELRLTDNLTIEDKDGKIIINRQKDFEGIIYYLMGYSRYLNMIREYEAYESIYSDKGR